MYARYAHIRRLSSRLRRKTSEFSMDDTKQKRAGANASARFLSPCASGAKKWPLQAAAVLSGATKVCSATVVFQQVLRRKSAVSFPTEISPTYGGSVPFLSARCHSPHRFPFPVTSPHRLPGSRLLTKGKQANLLRRPASLASCCTGLIYARRQSAMPTNCRLCTICTFKTV